MTINDITAHDRAIVDQFTRQAAGFAAAPELHGDDVTALIVEAANPGPRDRVIDLACGPGSVACALARCATHVVGLDATAAMLDQARTRAEKQGFADIEWLEGSIYDAPYPDGWFDICTCRFAFHHLQDPVRAFGEMVRLTAPGGRIVLCDGLASDDRQKAEAFNRMERLRDPSTVAFRTFETLRTLFIEAGLGEPEIRMFQVSYLAADLAEKSFPEGGDRSGLVALIEASVDGDRLGVGAQKTEAGVRIAYRSAVLSAIKS
ncbi:class I SAM-dependent methyltransferase [Acidiphilium iwatense]|uniref:Methyltransferase domain-containing protein n=1 Tax=Acidiphilium iwatense TaxID=768198 RepID=A0ABS9DW92_9PROT|nr:methyltransferase domain-containing protein [Acidiphilium iwatense]MCF3947010.1 methyltransferase domain-containing protein [Acidiphilium iwatense]